MREDELQRQVLELVDWYRMLAYHTHDSRRSRRGFPDLVIVGTKGVLFRELKSAKGRLTLEQSQWLEQLKAAGQDAAVWRPSDWPTRIRNEILDIR